MKFLTNKPKFYLQVLLLFEFACTHFPSCEGFFCTCFKNAFVSFRFASFLLLWLVCFSFHAGRIPLFCCWVYRTVTSGPLPYGFLWPWHMTWQPWCPVNQSSLRLDFFCWCFLYLWIWLKFLVLWMYSRALSWVMNAVILCGCAVFRYCIYLWQQQ